MPWCLIRYYHEEECNTSTAVDIKIFGNCLRQSFIPTCAVESQWRGYAVYLFSWYVMLVELDKSLNCFFWVKLI